MPVVAGGEAEEVVATLDRGDAAALAIARQGDGDRGISHEAFRSAKQGVMWKLSESVHPASGAARMAIGTASAPLRRDQATGRERLRGVTFAMLRVPSLTRSRDPGTSRRWRSQDVADGPGDPQSRGLMTVKGRKSWAHITVYWAFAGLFVAAGVRPSPCDKRVREDHAALCAAPSTTRPRQLDPEIALRGLASWCLGARDSPPGVWSRWLPGRRLPSEHLSPPTSGTALHFPPARPPAPPAPAGRAHRLGLCAYTRQPAKQ